MGELADTSAESSDSAAPERLNERATPRDRAEHPLRRERSIGRELALALGGVMAGLLIIALVWALTGRRAASALPAVGELNQPAPDFALPGMNGATVRLNDQRGKVVLVNFWATWCAPCREETPALQAVYQKLRDQGLAIVGVNLRNQEQPGPAGDANVRAFAARYGVTYLIALDSDGATARAFRISPIPTSYFIDQSGMIRYVRIGKITGPEVEALFARLWQEPAAR